MFSLAFLMISDESDSKFVEDLYIKYEQMMYKIAYNILQSGTDAEDAVQNTFLNIIDSLERIRVINDAQTKYYLATMVKHAAVDIQRKANRLPESNVMEELDNVEADISVEEIAMMKFEADEVRRVLKTLPDNEVEILFLNLVIGYQPSRIAELFGISPNTARQQVFRARKHLKQKCEKEEINQ